VSTSRQLPRIHEQHGLGPIERLDLRLFIDAQDESIVGRVHVKPDDVADLVHKQRIGRELEGLRSVWLQNQRHARSY
jgi:hypothetical protein